MTKRPFEDIDEMDSFIINSINSMVKQTDMLFILGDITHRLSVVKSNHLISCINGKKYLIKGNHDKCYDNSLFERICDYYELSYNGVRFDMMHYPLNNWHDMKKGAIQIHGHLHSTGNYNLNNRNNGILQYDVGIDANNYRPVSIVDILDFFSIK